MPKFTVVAAWRCKCGIHIKVVAESERAQPFETTSLAACPNCGDQQIVYADKILFIDDDTETTTQTFY